MENQISSLKKGDSVWALRTDSYGYCKKDNPYAVISRVSEDENPENDKIYIESDLFPQKDYWVRVYAFNEHFATSPPNKGEETEDEYEVEYKYINRTDAATHKETVTAKNSVYACNKLCTKYNWEVEWLTVTKLENFPVPSPEKTLEEIKDEVARGYGLDLNKAHDSEIFYSNQIYFDAVAEKCLSISKNNNYES